MVDCIRFMTQKAASKMIINLDIKKMVSVVKIINLDAKVSIKKIMVTLIFEIERGGIYTRMTLMN